MTPGTTFSDYQSRYQHVALERNDGILELRLHTNGEEAKWSTTKDGLHAELPNLFSDIARDDDNRVVIITGTGEAFMSTIDTKQVRDEPSHVWWARMHREGVAMLENLLAIPVPVICAVNGPATIHAELALLSDIVIASEDTFFADLVHSVAGYVPGDGVHTLWPALLGPNRGRYFLLTGQRIDALEALRLGLVGEVVPRPELMPRVRDLARNLLTSSPTTLRHTRTLLTRQLRKTLSDELGLGLAFESLAALEGARDPRAREQTSKARPDEGER